MSHEYRIPVIACVLRSGGDYLPGHVERLAKMVRHYVRGPFHFVCMSDMVWDTKHVDIYPLRMGWPGWWSKIELFNTFRNGAFYLDLDTTITGDITDMVQPTTGFWALQDFGDARARSTRRRMGSGVMHWGPGYHHLYTLFAADAEEYMRRSVTTDNWGDQGFLLNALCYAGSPPQFLQDRWPGQVRSYKWDVLLHGMTPDTRLVCFHGKPRPWDIKHNLEGT